MTITEHIRAHLLDRLGVTDPPRRLDLAELRETEWSPVFERLMRNRLLVGAFRYAPLASTNRAWDTMGSIIRRAEAYRHTGNREHLVDIANLALVEFERPGHLNPNWSPSDDGPHCNAV